MTQTRVLDRDTPNPGVRPVTHQTRVSDSGVSRVCGCRLYADSSFIKHPFGTILVKTDILGGGTVANRRGHGTHTG